MEKHTHLPDPSQLSILTGVILIAYAISQYLEVPINQIALQLPGIYIPINIEFRNLVSITVAILAAAGMDWVISGHPHNQGKDRLHHWLLPSLTAWVIGIPLFSIPIGPTWWGMFLIGGLLLVLVILSEYITVNPDDTRLTIVSIGLSALSLVLFLILAVSIRANGARLYLVIPAIGIGSGLVSLRIFYLRSGRTWQYAWSLCISLLLAQFAAGLHYLPLSPVQFGLLLVGFLYALISISESVIQNRFSRRVFIEPAIIFIVTIVLVLILG
jgi:hypothetical protein